MPFAAYSAGVAPAIGPLLEPGESFVAGSPLVHAMGTTEDVIVGDELRALLDPTIWVGLDSHPGGLLQRAAFGRSATGAPDSLGRRLHEQVGATQAPALAVTDRRLLIVRYDVEPERTGGPWWRRWFGPARRTAHPVWGLPLTDVLGAVRAPAGLLRRGQLLVGFTDGSTCTLVCPSPGLAGPAVAAIAPSPAAG